MIMNNELIEHLEMIHTTPMGDVRIKKNLQISCDDSVEWCKQQILNTDTRFEKKEKTGMSISNKAFSSSMQAPIPLLQRILINEKKCTICTLF